MSLGRASILQGSPVRSLMTDSRGILWIGSDRGVYWLHMQSNTLNLWQEAGERAIYPLAQTPDTTIWFGTEHGVYGVSGVHGATHRRFHPVYRVDERLLGPVRVAAAAPDGALWFADTEGAVVRLSASGDTAAPWRAELIGHDAGIRSDRIRRFTVGPDSSIWLATDGGLNRCRNGVWAHYGSAEGLRNRNAWCATPMQNDMVLVGNERGFEILEATSDGPQTVILPHSRVVAAGGSLALLLRGADQWQRTPEHLLRYSWRLDGGGWSRPEPFDRVVLSSIAPGEHAFEARALDGDLNWDATPARTRFTVERPLWGRWQLIALLALLAALLIHARIRLHLADKRLKERTDAG